MHFLRRREKKRKKNWYEIQNHKLIKFIIANSNTSQIWNKVSFTVIFTQGESIFIFPVIIPFTLFKFVQFLLIYLFALDSMLYFNFYIFIYSASKFLHIVLIFVNFQLI